MKVKTALGRLREHWFLAVFGVGIPVCLFCLYVGYPIVFNVYLSFTRWNGLGPRPIFDGIFNYRFLVESSSFWVSLANTLKWVLGTLIIANIFGLITAGLLQPKRVYLATLFRAIVFLPVTMSLVSVGIMFAFLLDPTFGIVPDVLHLLRMPDISLLGDPRVALYSLIGMFGWSYLGIPVMIYHAGISQIPPERYEAASLEGANGFQTIRYVTIPALRPVIVVVTLYSVIQGFKNFDLIAVVTSGGPGNSTNVLAFYMYILAFQERFFGIGSAVSVILLLLSLSFVVAYLRRVGESALNAAGN